MHGVKTLSCPGLVCPMSLNGDLCRVSCQANTDREAYAPLVLELPFPPSVNHYWRAVRVGNATRTLISAPGRAFRQEVAQRVMAERKAFGIDFGVAVAVTLHAPDNRRRDLDNFGGKALLDALTHAGVWRDDSRVRRLSMQWGETLRGGKTVVTIRRIG